MNPIICDAIRNRSIISFNYDGGQRTVEPYCHGVSRADNEVLRAYQIEGVSSSGNSSGWKLFDVSKIVQISVSSLTFHRNRSNYNSNDADMITIHCHV